MPSGRFYSAPIPTGWADFGQAIAAGMGQVSNDIIRDTYLRRQEERQDQLRREQRERENAMLEWQLQQEGFGQVGETGRLTPGAATLAGEHLAPMGIPGAMKSVVAPGQVVAAGEKTPVAPPVLPAPQLVAPSIATGIRPTPEPEKKPEGPAVPPTNPASAQVFYNPLIDKYMTYDPARSVAAKQEAWKYELTKQHQAEVRTQIQSLITKVVADDQITGEEAAELQAWGINPADVFDPEMRDKAVEKATKKEDERWRERYNIEQAGRREIALIQAASSGGGEMTANRQFVRTMVDFKNRAKALAVDGKPASSILAALQGEAEKQGLTIGELRDLIDQGLTEIRYGGVDPASLEAKVRQQLGMGTIDASGKVIRQGTPEYEALVQQMVADQMKAAGAQGEAEYRQRWSGGKPISIAPNMAAFGAMAAAAPGVAPPPASNPIAAATTPAAPRLNLYDTLNTGQSMIQPGPAPHPGGLPEIGRAVGERFRKGRGTLPFAGVYGPKPTATAAARGAARATRQAANAGLRAGIEQDFAAGLLTKAERDDLLKRLED